MRFAKRTLGAVLVFSILLTLCSCTKKEEIFTENDDGLIVSSSGTAYTFLAGEGILYCWKEWDEVVFEGGVRGEPTTSQHLGMSYQTGMFSIKGSQTDNILIRHRPDSEWREIYRKASLPPLDFSVDNCSRLELVFKSNPDHAVCGKGITDPVQIAQFLSDIRSGQTPHEADLYSLVRKPNGMLENCYTYGTIYGSFAEEPDVVIHMPVTSYNDQAYSIRMERREYVLPEEWLELLRGH